MAGTLEQLAWSHACPTRGCRSCFSQRVGCAASPRCDTYGVCAVVFCLMHAQRCTVPDIAMNISDPPHHAGSSLLLQRLVPPATLSQGSLSAARALPWHFRLPPGMGLACVHHHSTSGCRRRCQLQEAVSQPRRRQTNSAGRPTGGSCLRSTGRPSHITRTDTAAL